MPHDACLQPPFSTYVGISGYRTKKGRVRTWQEDKDPSSTMTGSTGLEETLMLLSKQSKLPEREFLCSGGKGWFLVSREVKSSPSVTTCLLSTAAREVEPLLQTADSHNTK